MSMAFYRFPLPDSSPNPDNDECSFNGCPNPYYAKGLCGAHYKQQLQNSFLAPLRTYPGVAEQFFYAHVDDNTDDCTLWPYAENGVGYGVFRRNHTTHYVHILACERHHGLRPEGMEVCHAARSICEGPACFNYRHLRWGTRAENSADRIADGTTSRGMAHGGAKLTDDQIREIRAMHNGFRKRPYLSEIAAKFGVSKSTISVITRRERWTHIDDKWTEQEESARQTDLGDHMNDLDHHNKETL